MTTTNMEMVNDRSKFLTLDCTQIYVLQVKYIGIFFLNKNTCTGVSDVCTYKIICNTTYHSSKLKF